MLKLPRWWNLPAGRQVGRQNMVGTYAIHSVTRNYIYVGLSGNPNRRLSEHNNGKNKTTRPYRPFKLLYLKWFAKRKEARTHEIYLKSGIGKEFLKKLRDSKHD